MIRSIAAKFPQPSVSTTLGALARYLNGFPFKPSELGHEGTPVVRIKQLVDLKAPLDKTLVQVGDDYRLQNGDIILSWSGTITTRVWNRGDAILNQHLFKVVADEAVATLYLYQLLRAHEVALQNKAHGSTMRHITKPELLGHPVTIHTAPEQRKIAEFFSLLDERIGKQETKVSLLQEQKRGYMQRIFSQALRFKQEDGSEYPEWQKSTFGEIASYVNGFPFKPSDLGDEGTPVVRIKQLLDEKANLDKTSREVQKEYWLQDGDIVLSWSGTIASRIWSRGAAILNQHLFKVEPKAGVNRQFLYQLLGFHETALQSKAHGGTMKHITKPALFGHQVLMPSLSEQKAIANLLALLDERILHETTKLRLLTEQKAGYLQQLFG